MKQRISKIRMIAYAAVAVTAAILTAEVGVRILVPDSGGFELNHKYWMLARHTNLYGQYDAADIVEFEDFNINIQKKPGEKRVICLGSSSTYGAGLKDRRRAFPQLLNEMIPEATVINGGWGGYNSYELWIYLSEVLVRLDPDVVLFYYGGNECSEQSAKEYYPKVKKIVARMKSRGRNHFDDLEDAVAYGTANPVALRAWSVFRKSRLFLLLRNRIIRKRYEQEMRLAKYRNLEECLTMIKPTTAGIFKNMVKLSQKNNFELIFASEIASCSQHANEAISDLMNIFCEYTEAQCVDALDALDLRKDPGIFLDTTHLTPKGHKILAELLKPVILRALKLP